MGCVWVVYGLCMVGEMLKIHCTVREILERDLAMVIGPQWLHCTALHCAALHCTALHCTALHCTALHCTMVVWSGGVITVRGRLHSQISPCPGLDCTALHCTALICTTMSCTALHCTHVHYNELHCTALHMHCSISPWYYIKAEQKLRQFSEVY
jgi:hypothetical protein